jgi:hypothetical protein
MEKWILLAQQTQQTPGVSGSLSSAKDFIPLISVIVGSVLTAVFGVIVTLLLKWKDTEIKRIESEKKAEAERLQLQKDADIRLLTVEKEGELKLIRQESATILATKDNEIANLQFQIKALEKTHADFRQFTTTAPLEFVKDIKPILEEYIQELREKLKDSTGKNEQLRLELERKAEHFEKQIKKLSEIEEFLVERYKSSQEVITWLTVNQKRLGDEVCRLALKIANTSQNEQAIELKQKAPQFLRDVQDYLLVTSKCLEFGRPNLLDRVNIKPVIPVKFYVDAFKIIRDKKAPSELSNKDARRELDVYLNYLIDMLGTRFS